MRVRKRKRKAKAKEMQKQSWARVGDEPSCEDVEQRSLSAGTITPIRMAKKAVSKAPSMDLIDGKQDCWSRRRTEEPACAAPSLNRRREAL